MSNSKDGCLLYTLAIGVVIILCIVLVLFCFVRPINKVCNMREVMVTVTEKTVKNGEDSGKYLVFAEDDDGNVQTYEITDSLLRFRFNSSDVYAAIKPGNRYKFTVGGSRNHFFSWYPNIYEYKLIESYTPPDKLVPIKDKE